jgi:hypothetical protein
MVGSTIFSVKSEDTFGQTSRRRPCLFVSRLDTLIEVQARSQVGM